MGNINGSCLCGAIKYEVHGPLRPIVACHCTQCRKSSGHYGAATRAKKADVTLIGDCLKWFRSSEKAERGFCSNCGSNLFWRRIDGDRISIWAGSIDGPSGLKLVGQLFVETAGDYYSVPDVPTLEQSELV
jgi:hypothetical protein